MQTSRFPCVVLAIATLWAIGTSPASAQPIDFFFKGKTINLYVGFNPGGSYDYFGRLAARYMGKHIPGNPTIVVHNMPGAGSLQAANFIYAQAPKDGTAWAI